MKEIEVSLIVTIYNEPIEKVYFSLRSIMMQRNVNYEVIVADNGSDDDYEPKLSRFFAEHSFERFQIIKQSKNVGIVANICSALSLARGRYAKVIFTGDALYSESTLRIVIDSLESYNADAVFGDIITFPEGEEGGFRLLNFPRNKESYPPARHHESNEALFRNMASKADYITSVALFWRTDTLLELEAQLREIFQVKYSDDLAVLLLLSDEMRKIFYINFPVIFYEVGSGISTTDKSTESYLRLYDDNRNLYRALSGMKPYGMSLRNVRFMWFCKRLFVICFPGIYGRLRQQNISGSSSEFELPQDAAAFFLRCKSVG